MRHASLAVFAASASTIVLVLCALYAVGRTVPHGTMWRNNAMTAGQDIWLFDSGQYLAWRWCDVCSRRQIRGRWTQSGAVLRLTPTAPAGPVVSLRKVTVKGCSVLLPSDDADGTDHFNPFLAYVRKGDDCIGGLLARTLPHKGTEP